MINDQQLQTTKLRPPYALPSFLICGVAKGGTTSLYRYLEEHPSICMSTIKEVNYFSNHYEKGIEWYARHFERCVGARLIGEASASYMTDCDAAMRIYNVIPHAKLIFILRDPISRAYSSYWFRVRRGAQDAAEGFSSAIRTLMGQSIYVKPGFYVDHLLRFLAFFPREQIHVTFTEELDRKPERCLRACFNFLDIEYFFQSTFGARHNVRRVPRSPLSAKVLRAWFAARLRVRPFVPIALRRASKPLWQPVRNLLLDTRPTPSVTEEDRAYLEAIYGPYNERLSSLVDIDLSRVWE